MPPGWYHGQGDPDGTVRWWDGSTWVGEPQAGRPGFGPDTQQPTAPEPPAAPITSTPPQFGAAEQPAAVPSSGIPTFPGAPGAAPSGFAQATGGTDADRGPIDWFKLALSRWNQFSGRSRRAEYWWFTLIYFGLAMCGIIAALILGAVSSALGGLTLIVVLLVLFLGLIPSYAVGCRRLHDTNKSGWLLLISNVPVLGLILVIFYFIDGDKGSNKYGQSPKY